MTGNGGTRTYKPHSFSVVIVMTYTYRLRKVPTTLQGLAKKGYKLCIFSNQAGIENGKQKAVDIQQKITDICLKVRIRVTHSCVDVLSERCGVCVVCASGAALD